jgi:hypothetical protein
VGGSSVMDQVRLIHWMDEMLKLVDSASATHP